MNDNEKKREELQDEIIEKKLEEWQDKKIGEKLEESFEKAGSIVNNNDKLERLLQRLEKKLRSVPVAGGALAYVPIMISALRMHLKREYTEIPAASLLAIAAALIYWLAPVDAVLDLIPAIGYVDDAAVISAAVLLIKSDLDDFIIWRSQNGLEEVDIPDYKELQKESRGVTSVFRSFLRSKRK